MWVRAWYQTNWFESQPSRSKKGITNNIVNNDLDILGSWQCHLATILQSKLINGDNEFIPSLVSLYNDCKRIWILIFNNIYTSNYNNDSLFSQKFQIKHIHYNIATHIDVMLAWSCNEWAGYQRNRGFIELAAKMNKIIKRKTMLWFMLYNYSKVKKI